MCCMPQAAPQLHPKPASSRLPLKSRIRISGAFQCNVTRSCERVVSPLPSLLPPLPATAPLISLGRISFASFGLSFALVFIIFLYIVFCFIHFVFPFGQRISLSTAFRMHFSSLSISLSRQQVGRLIDNFDFSS